MALFASAGNLVTFRPMQWAWGGRMLGFAGTSAAGGNQISRAGHDLQWRGDRRRARNGGLTGWQGHWTNAKDTNHKPIPFKLASTQTLTATGIATGYASGTARRIIEYLVATGIGSAESIGGTSQPVIQDLSDDQFYTFGGTTGTGQENAQSFQVSKACSLNQVDLHLSKLGSPADNFIVDIVSTLDGSVLATATIAASSVTGTDQSTGAYKSFVFASPASLTAGTTYYIQTRRSGARDTGNAVGWSIQTTGADRYSGGGAWSRSGPSQSWAIQDSGNDDMRFKVTVTGGATVVSATYNIVPTGIVSTEVYGSSRISRTLPSLLSNTAEGGTNGVAATAGNSGGASGTAWDAVSLGAGSVVIYDNTHAYTSLAYNIDPANNATAYLAWTAGTIGSLTDFNVRGYFYFTANPAATLTLMRFLDPSSSHLFSIRITTTGLLQAIDSTNSVVLASFSNAISLNHWIRVEAHFVVDPTSGSIEVKLFNNPDIDQATESNVASSLNTGTVVSVVRIGSTLGANTDLPSFWVDNVAIGTSGYIGPTIHVLGPTGIASSEAHGTTTVTPGPVTLVASGIATAYASGTARIVLYLKPTGIASAEAHGITVVVATYTISPTGIVTAYASGSARIVLYLKPTGIASTEAHGTTTVLRGTITITPTGIVTGYASGSARIILYLKPTGIVSAEAHGTTVVTTTYTISPAGIATAYASGAARIVLYLKPTGIATAEAHGTTVVLRGTVTITPTGIASAEAHGTTVVLATYTIVTTGIASAYASGTATVLRGAVTITPTGIATAYASGTATVLTFYTILPTGIASAEAHGTTVVATGAFTISPIGIPTGYASGTATVLTFYTISPTGITSSEAFGTAVFFVTTYLQATGIASTEAFGLPVIVLYLSPAGVPSSEAFGLASLYLLNRIFPTGIPTGQSMGHALLSMYLLATSIDTAEVFGQAAFVGDVILTPGGIPTGVAFGQITIVQVPFLFPDGIVSEEAFGATVVQALYRLTITAGIPSLEAHGVALVIPGAAFVRPSGVPPGYVSGTAIMVLYLKPAGIASAVSFGHDTLYLLASIRPTGIASAQVFGIAHVLPGGVGVFPTGIPSAEAFGPGIIVFIFVVTISKIGFYREVSAVEGGTTDGVIQKTGFYDGNGESKSGAETGLIKKTGEYHLVDEI